MADCTLCGCRWVNGYMGCSRAGCNEYRMVTECNEWPVSLGLSIRRFVRACEVEGLRESAFAYAEAAADHAADFNERASVEAFHRLEDALDRLAALARVGGER